jgi:hypothetical protein
MNIYISIDGVLRNFINRFHYHYEQAYIDVEEPSTEFDYKVTEPLTNNNLMDHFAFQSKEEFEFFTYIEYPMELFGHSPVSYTGVINDLNNFIHENQDNTITLVGLDEFGKARPATLFFLSRNGCMATNIKFIKTEDITKEWGDVDVWISDNKKIMDLCPENKKFRLFKTKYNEHFTCEDKLDKLFVSKNSSEIKLIE